MDKLPAFFAMVLCSAVGCQPSNDEKPETLYGQSSHPELAAEQLSAYDLTGKFCWLMKDSASLVKLRVTGWGAEQDVTFPSTGASAYRMSPVTVVMDKTLAGVPLTGQQTLFVGGAILASGAFSDGDLGSGNGLDPALAYVRHVDGTLVVHTQGWFAQSALGSPAQSANDAGKSAWSESEISAGATDPNCPPTPWQ